MEPERLNTAFKRFRHWILARGIFIHFKIIKNCSEADGCSAAQDSPIHCLEWDPTVRNCVPKLNHIIPVHFPYKIYTLYVLIYPSIYAKISKVVSFFP